MKKIKLLAPLLAMTTVGSIAMPLVTLASCGNDSKQEDITLDESTAKEQTTTANSTMTTYTFNLKDKLNWNTNDDEPDEVDVDVEDVETTDDVTVEVSALQYDPETGKFYVTITTSKEDGTLNENDTVTFSLNLHCHKKGSKLDRWAKKFTQFIVKYSSSQLVSGHFDDTDTIKQIKSEDKGEVNVSLDFVVTDEWKQNPTSEETEAGICDINKLKCYVLTDQNHVHFIDTISLPSYSTPVTTTLSEDNTSLNVSFQANISDLAVADASKARFTLVFTYPDSTVFQTIGGFSVSYVTSVVEPKAELVGSREQHYYTPKNSDTETASNFIAFYINDTETTYTADELIVELVDKERKGTTIEFSEKYMLYDETGERQVLAVNYTLKQDKEKSGRWIDMSNVSLDIKSTKTENDWTQTIKGLTFTKVDKLTQTSLISYDPKTLNEVTWTKNESMRFDDVLRTCFPFADLNYFTYTNAFAWFNEQESNTDPIKTDVTIEQLGYLLETDYYSKATINTNELTEGNTYNAKIMVYVITYNAAYYYCLNVDDITITGE